MGQATGPSTQLIIEYKKEESSGLINQSLFYLSWLNDHKGDFAVAAQREIGAIKEIDWRDIRVICLAPGYKKYDLHAVQMMGANIELWQYKRFDNGSLYLEEIFGRSSRRKIQINGEKVKDRKMVEAGQKAAITKKTAIYIIEQHLEGKEQKIVDLAEQIRKFAMELDDGVEEVPKKNYIAYKMSQNFLCMEVQSRKLLLHLKCEMKSPDFSMPSNGRDTSDLGHYGTGDFELTISSESDVEDAKKYIKASFDCVGG